VPEVNGRLSRRGRLGKPHAWLRVQWRLTRRGARPMSLEAEGEGRVGWLRCTALRRGDAMAWNMAGRCRPMPVVAEGGAAQGASNGQPVRPLVWDAVEE